MAPLSAVPLLAEVTALWHRKVELTQKVLDEEEKALTVGSRQELEREVDALAAKHAHLVGGPALARLPVVREGDSAAAAGGSEDRLEEHASTSDLRILLDIAEGARVSRSWVLPPALRLGNRSVMCAIPPPLTWDRRRRGVAHESD
jgi:hypothetical protein